MTEPPEFHTKIQSPLSPTPLHPPEPTNIPLLQKQIDPVFNMTSTHIDPPQSAVAFPASSSLDPIASSVVADSPADSSFSDAYKEEVGGKEMGQDALANQDAVSDDYAMTFDTDGEEHSDSQDVSRDVVEQETGALPARKLILDSSQSGPVNDPTQPHPLPTHLRAGAAATSNPESTAVQTETETTQPNANSYEEIASGEIDIQQLLDNITANAEKNEAVSALNTPTSANLSIDSIPKAGSGLPTHASLPPRPQVPRPNYNDDISKYHTGTTNFSQPLSTYKSPPGVNVPIVAAGAPGTYTDARNGLPPPPTVSFRQLPPNTGSPISPGTYPQVSRVPTQDRPARPDPSEDVGDSDIRWGPDIQKKYDQFLAEERVYVTDGQWDRFPVGSRLFIGK
jgi:nuclear polyadenylated RNA-binding protein 3